MNYLYRVITMSMFTDLTCWFSNNEINVVLILYMLYFSFLNRRI